MGFVGSKQRRVVQLHRQFASPFRDFIAHTAKLPPLDRHIAAMGMREAARGFIENYRDAMLAVQMSETERETRGNDKYC